MVSGPALATVITTSSELFWAPLTALSLTVNLKLKVRSTEDNTSHVSETPFTGKVLSIEVEGTRLLNAGPFVLVELRVHPKSLAAVSLSSCSQVKVIASPLASEALPFSVKGVLLGTV